MEAEARSPTTVGRRTFREHFFGQILRDAVRYVPARYHEHPYPERLRTQSRTARWAMAARASLADVARRSVHRAVTARWAPWAEHAAEELAAAAARMEELEAGYEVLSDEASRELYVKLLEWRVLGPRRVPLPVSPDRYREGLERVHRDLLRESGTRRVEDPYFPELNRYALELAGAEVTVETDETCMHDVFVLEEYAYEQGPVVVRAQPGDVVLDGGGGYGDTALYFAGLVGEGGRVIVAEMDPVNRACIEQNLGRNPELAPRVSVCDAALWESSGASLPFLVRGKMSRVVGEDGAEAGSVRTTTLDDLLEGEGVERLDFLKLDVEGSELAVLKGATRTLHELRPKLAIAVYHDPTDLSRIPRYIHDLGLGYRLYLDHTSAGGDETVLFAAPPAESQ